MKLEDNKETAVANRIKGLDSRSVDGGGSRPVERISQSAAVAPAAPASTGSVDSVQITASARNLAGLSQAIKDTPDVDSLRVEALQQAISHGSYSIDDGRIADQLIKLESDLGAAAA